VGTRSLPYRDRDGLYHIKGRQAMADKREIKELVWMMVPLLNAAGGLQKTFITPLIRYDTKKCCEEKNHITNFEESEYRQELEERMADYRNWCRETLHRCRIGGIRTMGGMDLLARSEDADGIDGPLRGLNAVHRTEEEYRRMAREVNIIMSGQRALPGAAPKTARRLSAEGAAIRHDTPAGKRFAGAPGRK